MRRITLVWASSLALLIALLALASTAAAAEFTQCKPVDKDAGCQFLITVTKSGVKVTEDDEGLGPYDGEDDTLVGIENSSSAPISSLPLAAEEDIFGFDGDGICDPPGPPRAPGCVVLAENANHETPTVAPGTACAVEAEATENDEAEPCGYAPPLGEPAGMSAFGEGATPVGFAANGDVVAGYEGPRNWYSDISEDAHSGVVNFSPALAPGESTYFGLEADMTGKALEAVSPGSFVAPTAPMAITEAASSATQSSATLVASVNPDGLEVTACYFEYGTSTSYGSSATCSALPGSGTSPVAVSVSITGLTANTTYHFRLVATNADGTSYGSDEIFSTVLPPPVLGKSVNVSVVSGKVYVALPPTAGATLASLAGPLESAVEMLSKTPSLHKGLKFVPLVQPRQLPVGSVLKTTAGIARVTTATATQGKLQAGNFGAGIFKILQNREQKGLTDLDIMDNRSRHKVCASLGKGRALASALSAKVLGRLNSSAHGKFSTHGQYSAATVRGTVWSVANRCDGTYTKVKRDVVSVRDFVTRKTIILHAGQHYLARPRR